MAMAQTPTIVPLSDVEATQWKHSNDLIAKDKELLQRDEDDQTFLRIKINHDHRLTNNDIIDDKYLMRQTNVLVFGTNGWVTATGSGILTVSQ
jgi:hypothetical protein